MSDQTTFVLDTDIGSDVDDLLALAMVLGSPEFRLSAVTTVYGDVDLRARIVARAFAEAGRPSPPIAAGRSTTRSGREVWWPGHEGSTIEDLESQSFGARRDAIDVLATSARLGAVGPLTNVAEAVERPGHRIQRITMMGGAFDGRSEHNIRSDAAAADAVFRSGVRVTTVGIEQTERVRFTAGHLGQLGGGLGRMLDAEVQRYWDVTGETGNVPHDAVAVLMLAMPELFRFSRGWISVEAGAGAGADAITRFRVDPDGPHEVVSDLDVEGVERQIIRRIGTACG